jgi:peptidoglycan/LPS O-acetylase OafA/YrhL
MGLFVMTPAPFKEFMQSAFFVVIFLANVFFWKRDDYFSEPSEQTPLLHTWSLSIEEQFYVLFPLTLAWVWENSRKLTLPFFVAAILASILLSIHAEKSDPASSFYLFQNRAWELLVGGLLASLPPQRQKLLSSLPSVGIILIVVSVCAFGNRETSVGWNTAFAVLGATLIFFLEMVATLELDY